MRVWGALKLALLIGSGGLSIVFQIGVDPRGHLRGLGFLNEMIERNLRGVVVHQGDLVTVNESGLGPQYAIHRPQRGFPLPEAVLRKRDTLTGVSRRWFCRRDGCGWLSICQRRLDPLRQLGSIPNVVFSRDEILAIGIDEAHDLEIKRRFTEAFQHGCIGTGVVIMDEQWDEILLNRHHYFSIAEHVLAELLAARATGDFLKQEENRLAGFPRLLGGRRVVPLPFYLTHCRGILLRHFGMAACRQADDDRTQRHRISYFHTSESVRLRDLFP